jgi:hypothetical protein
MKHAIAFGTGFLVAAVIGLLAAAQSSTQDLPIGERVSKLEADLVSLREEVALLRRVVLSNSESPQRKATPPAIATDPFVGKIVELALAEVDPSMRESVAKLRKEATDFDERARKLEVEAATSSAQSKEAKKKQAQELRDKAKKVRGDAERVQRTIDDPDKKICVWNGSRVVLLLVPSERYGSIKRVPLGGFVTWSGERVGARPDREVFDVRSVSPADEPSGFNHVDGVECDMEIP